MTQLRHTTAPRLVMLLAIGSCCAGAEVPAPRVIAPAITTAPGPLAPSVQPDLDRSVLFEHSPHMINAKAKPKTIYEPIAEGGYQLTGGTRAFVRHINHGKNIVVTGETPRFRVTTSTGSGCYLGDHRTYPLFDRPDATKGDVKPSFGELRLMVPAADGKPLWLDELPGTTVRFLAGSSHYEVKAPTGTWTAAVTIAPTMTGNGFICAVAFDRPVSLRWQLAGIRYKDGEARANRVASKGAHAIITDPLLPRGQVVIGWDGGGAVQAVKDAAGERAEAVATTPKSTYHIIHTWGVDGHDQAKAQAAMDRLVNEHTKAWRKPVAILQERWFDWMITRALEPERRWQELARDAAGALKKSLDHWQARRKAFRIATPDPHLTALINWNQSASDYHRQGPGLLHGTELWAMYSHISVGWYGKEWGGDHEAIAENLRYYAAFQRKDGYIRWMSEAMMPYDAEDNTNYWIDQVWQHYRWTGDRDFLADMWPHVQRAMTYVPKGDPDGDGLHRAFYEYWNADSNGKGPKAAAPTATAWMACTAAAHCAQAMQDAAKTAEYTAMAQKIRAAAMAQLWKDGRFGSIGSDGIWRGHGAIWEQYLAINAGMIAGEQARNALRWLDAHLGFEPDPGVRLLMCSDFWPLRWSVQWVVTGDTALAIQAGMRHGDADLWWPHLRTLAKAPFQDDGGGPGIRMAVNNHGCAGGEREDVDSDDPHTQVAVRGLFGIEPNLHEGRIDITPGFPSDWTTASIRTPDLHYEYQRDGQTATFTITTPRPLIKRVRACWGGEEVTTPAETVSTVRLRCVPPPARPAAKTDTIVRTSQVPLKPYAPLTADERRRLVQVDLRPACNQTLEQLWTTTRFTFDHTDHPAPLTSWWGNPVLAMPDGPTQLDTPMGVAFLIQGEAAKPGVIALSSWKPNPLPATTTIPIATRCERVYLLMQNYVHPMKCYVPNGEVVLRYTQGAPVTTSLVPPYNLDCAFQQFALEGLDVPLGTVKKAMEGWMTAGERPTRARAQVLQITADPQRTLEAIEIRATCSEGIIGLTGLTLLTTP